MIYEGDCIRADRIDGDFVELFLDRQGSGVNQLDQRTIAQLRFAVERIKNEHMVAGILVSSAKEGFCVGEDLSEFRSLFSLPQSALAVQVRAMNEALVALEDLDIPTVAAVNGYALGGGFELALATSLRVFSSGVRVGLPEVMLGLIPAFGGMVRLPRLSSPQAALEWILSGRDIGVELALRSGVADATCEAAHLRACALDLLERAASGKVAWRNRQEVKREPCRSIDRQGLDAAHSRLLEVSSAGGTAAARRAVIEVFEQSLPLHREEAFDVAADVFAFLANTQASAALVQTFLNRRGLRRRMRALAQSAPRPDAVGVARHARAVAFGVASAMRGMSVSVLGSGPLNPSWVSYVQADTGLRADDAASALSALGTESQGVGRFALVIDAGPQGSRSASSEELLTSCGVLVHLTVETSLDVLAKTMARPERLVGMNVFGSLATADVIELVRTPSTTDEATAVAVRYVRTLGKTALVVEPGHPSVVAPVLAGHFALAHRLVAAGNSREWIDATLRAQGWSRGPFELWEMLKQDEDVVRQLAFSGLVTFPAIAAEAFVDSGDAAHELGQLFAMELALASCRRLETGAVASASELDVAISLHVGFPFELGGPLQYLDWLGAAHAIALCNQLGLDVRGVPPMLERMALEGQTFFRPDRLSQFAEVDL